LSVILIYKLTEVIAFIAMLVPNTKLLAMLMLVYLPSTDCKSFTIHFLSPKGNTFAMIFPLIRALGTGPKCLESLEYPKLSPTTQT
jgi:hypothetical protein